MEYFLKSTAILVLFYVFYKLFLQRETFFQSNRFYFLMGLFAATILPLIIIPKYIEVSTITMSSNVNLINGTATIQESSFNWTQLLIILYLIGVVFFTIRFFTQLGSLIWFLIRQEKIKKGKFIFIQTTKKIAPFSFYNFIVYNTNDFRESELEQIITHEKIHVNQLHSLDIMLSQIYAIFNWFNPLIWLYIKEMQNNLEFIADEFTQNITPEKKKYQYLILKTMSPDYQMALTSNFYNSLIKKRINMLQKIRSKKTMYFKYALIIPILIAFVFTFNTKIIAQQKQLKTIEIHSDIEIEVITKDFQKKDLENLKNKLEGKDIIFKYSKLKYNDTDEITSISISVKNQKGSKASLSKNGTDPINPILMKIDNEANSISLGNISDIVHHDNMVFTSNGKEMYKRVVIKKMIDGDQELVLFSEDSTNTFRLKGDNGFVFITDDKSEFHIGDKKHNFTKIWVSKDGDTTKIKKMKIIEIDEGNDGSEHVIIKKGDNLHKRNEIIIKTDHRIHTNHSNVQFIDSDDKNSLIFVDGKKIENDKLKDIEHSNIETIEILKGDKAVEKYGEKAKDGVILIKTKKDK